jgi:hypothetical protein
LGHVGDESYARNLRLDADAGTDHHRALDEVAADAIAAGLLPSVVDRISVPANAILEALHEDVERFA